VAPSPITSDVGTEFDDIDDPVDEQSTSPRATVTAPSNVAQTKAVFAKSPDLRVCYGKTTSNMLKLKMNAQIDPLKAINSRMQGRPDEDSEPQSVIHVPTGFGNFVCYLCRTLSYTDNLIGSTNAASTVEKHYLLDRRNICFGRE